MFMVMRMLYITYLWSLVNDILKKASVQYNHSFLASVHYQRTTVDIFEKWKSKRKSCMGGGLSDNKCHFNLLKDPWIFFQQMRQMSYLQFYLHYACIL